MTQKKSVSTSLKSSRRSVRLWGAYGPRARLPDADDQGRPAGQNNLPAPAQAPLSLRVRQALLREEHLSRPLSARHQTGHRRRALRSVVLPDHGRVDDGIDRRDHGAAKRSRQVFEVHWFDPAVQKIHIAHLLFCAKKAGQKTDVSVCLLSGCYFFEQLALRAGDTLSYPRIRAGLSSMASPPRASGSQTVGPVAISALGDNDILCDQFIQIIPCA